MTTAVKLPVEIEVEDQKLLKLELGIKASIQLVEHDSESREELEDAVQSARSKICNLSKSNNSFHSLINEWAYEKNFEETIAPLHEKHATMLQVLQTALRKAYLIGDEKVTEIERSELIGSPQTPGNRNSARHRKVDKKQMADKAGQITQNLMDIARMMDAQVKKGEETNTVLQESSEMIKQTGEEFKSLGGMISVARKLINKYNRRELTDTLLIFFGLVLFFATVLYIISKRI